MIGPIMYGPSSMHTAGACRVARAAWQLFGEQEIVEAHLTLHGPFRVPEGGILNKALVAGLLGYDTDHDRLNHSHEDMAAKGGVVTYENSDEPCPHSNSIRFILKGKDGRTLEVMGASIGGGMIDIYLLAGAEIHIAGDYHTLVAFCRDAAAMAGPIGELASSLRDPAVETALSPDGRTQLVLVKSPKPIPEAFSQAVSALEGIDRVSGHRQFE